VSSSRFALFRYGIIEVVKTTGYFERKVLENPDRRGITVELCEGVVSEAEHVEEQPDDRFRFWGYVPERRLYLRVITSGDREVLINAFSTATSPANRGGVDEDRILP